MFLRVTATVTLYYDLYCAMKMADFKTRELEFVRKGFAERNNFSEGFSKPEKDAREIRVRGTAPQDFFHSNCLFEGIRGMETLSTTPSMAYLSWNVATWSMVTLLWMTKKRKVSKFPPQLLILKAYSFTRGPCIVGGGH